MVINLLAGTPSDKNRAKRGLAKFINNKLVCALSSAMLCRLIESIEKGIPYNRTAFKVRITKLGLSYCNQQAKKIFSDIFHRDIDITVGPYNTNFSINNPIARAIQDKFEVATKKVYSMMSNKKLMDDYNEGMRSAEYGHSLKSFKEEEDIRMCILAKTIGCDAILSEDKHFIFLNELKEKHPVLEKNFSKIIFVGKR